MKKVKLKRIPIKDKFAYGLDVCNGCFFESLYEYTNDENYCIIQEIPEFKCCVKSKDYIWVKE